MDKASTSSYFRSHLNWDSAYANPASASPFGSPDYDFYQWYPDAQPVNQQPQQPQQPDVPIPTQPQGPLPAQPTRRQVVLPVQPTARHNGDGDQLETATLSPLAGSDHYVRLTMRVVNPLGADLSLASYSCYLSPPDAGIAVVTTGRYSQTRDAPTTGTSSQPASTSLGAQGLTVDLTSEGMDAFGTFYCLGAQTDRDTTTEIGIFLTSDPKIIPAFGRFTKIANLGDTGVVIEMTLRSPADALTNRVQWRKGGGDIIVEATGLDSLSFSQPITESDGCIYECYYANERNQARHGIMRLIVRGCPTGRWGPPRCTGICDMCFNGGVCDHVTGRCVCPPGFMGNNCERACGYNHFGTLCEYECSSSADGPLGCRGSQFCLPDPYGCSCNAGFRGLECYTDCDAGSFGAGCLQTCHCASGQCDRFTGRCLGSPSGCSSGWSGENCQVPVRCPRGYYGTNCLRKCHCESDAACSKVTGRCPRKRCEAGYAVYSGQQYCSECQPGSFGRGCTQTCRCQSESCHPETGECSGDCFDRYLMPTCKAGIVSITTRRINAGQTALFNCTVASVDLAHLPAASTILLYRGTEGRNDTGVFRLGSITTRARASSVIVRFGVNRIRIDESIRCVAVSADNTILAHFRTTSDTFTLPALTETPRVTSRTAESATLRWNSWTSAGANSVGDPPLVAYHVVYRRNDTGGSWEAGKRVPSSRTSVVQGGLSAHTWYDISIVAVREGLGGEGPPSPFITFRTNCEVPAKPSAVLVSSDVKFPKQFGLAWQTPDQSLIKCPSGLVGYNIYYREIDSVYSESGTHRLFNPLVNSHIVTGLHAYTKYMISMSLLNEAGEGERSAETVAYSPEEAPPAPIHFTVLESSSEGAMLSWETPSPPNVNGKIRHYELSYRMSDQHDDTSSEPSTIRVGETSFSVKYRVMSLVANVTYIFKVRTVNGVGPSEWSDNVSATTVDPPAALMKSERSVHGPVIGLSIVGVFVGLLLVVGLSVGGTRLRKVLRAQKKDELSTLRDTVAFTRPTIPDDEYMTTIETPTRPTKPAPWQARDDDHRYEYIDMPHATGIPVMRFALLAKESETVIHSYPVMDGQADHVPSWRV
ncbi:tyrosine-protein kinase receptor Tie-1-like [Diadema antillarum]|uniref:tyrosine-protein kinase receptor Tie-1-like n=1 Tax=Diadema antillarum TaxID=105358 RepID=UPI003A8ADA75